MLTGAGRGFCAGQDLNDRAVAPGEAVDLGESVELRYNPLIRTSGVAADAGDRPGQRRRRRRRRQYRSGLRHRHRREDRAKFIQSFAAIGLIPDSGGTWVLPRLVGQARALGLALTGEPLAAEQAADWGLIWKAVDDDQLDAEVDALAARFAAGPTRGLAADQADDPRKLGPEPRRRARPPARRDARARLLATIIARASPPSWKSASPISPGK